MDISDTFEKDPSSKFQVSETMHTLTISYKWFSYKHVFLAFFCLFWDGFLAVWYSIAFGTMGEAGGFSLLMVIFPLIHVAVGVGLTYYTLCGFLNRTYIKVNSHYLEIVFKPLPWKGAKKIPADKIKQLYVKEKVTRGKNGNSYTYPIRMIDMNGKDTLLLAGDTMGSPEQSRFIENKIEAFLGITDVYVPGEYGAKERASERKSRESIKFARKSNKGIGSEDLTIYDLYQGCILDLKDKSWEVCREVQYDWENGYTHRQVDIFCKNGQLCIYLWKEVGENMIFAQNRFNLYREVIGLEDNLIKDSKPPHSLTYKGKTFWRERAYRGEKFLISEHGQPSFPVRNWLYFSEDGNELLRVEDFDNFDWQAYHGKKILEREIMNILPAAEPEKV